MKGHVPEESTDQHEDGSFASLPWTATMESKPCGETISLLARIKHILADYPFSAGLLRELLQNSDDARATQQIFILDYRTHLSESLYHPGLKDTQGPALLAFNNATFTEQDWTALQTIEKSSKEADTSKIGKYGLGIRACYHITDFLQVLSGQDLVIFDPQRSVSSDGGVRLSFKPGGIDGIRDHIASFRHFLPAGWNGERFEGTIIRLPLRNRPSKLREKTVSPHEIRCLFQDFIDGEINMSMLFLQHLRSIDVSLIHDGGKEEEHLASCTIENTQDIRDSAVERVVRVVLPPCFPYEERWVVSHQSSPLDEAAQLLRQRVGSVCDTALQEHKLRPDVGIAFPLPNSPALPNVESIGRLFTFLRLPIETGFPLHVHGCFALTTSRQNLRNRDDNGVVRGSTDHVFAEWNKVLFEDLIPKAWAQMLETLCMHFAPPVEIFSVWPAAQSETRTGAGAYWQTIPQDVFAAVLQNDLSVWPIISGGHYKLSDVFVAPDGVDLTLLGALSNAGLKVCGPVPAHLLKMISGHSTFRARILTPRLAGDALRVHSASSPGYIDHLQRTEVLAILRFLLTSNDLSNIIGIPIVPTASGTLVALSAPNVEPIRILLDEEEFTLFSECDTEAIRLSDLPPFSTAIFGSEGPSKLNVRFLDIERVVQYLAAHPMQRLTTIRGPRPAPQAVAFLSRFWRWMYGFMSHPDQLPQLLRELYLLPCTHGMEQVNIYKPVFEATSIHNPGLIQYLTKIGVPFLLDSVESAALDVLKKYGIVKSTNDIHALLDCISRRRLSLLPLQDADVPDILQHFNLNMGNPSIACYNMAQKTTFKQLPIFPVVELVENGFSMVITRRWASVDQLTVYGVSSLELLPKLPNTVFLDFTSDFLSVSLLPHLNTARHLPLTDIEILAISIERLSHQSMSHLAYILRHVVSRRDHLTPALRDSLRSQRFIMSSSGNLQAPLRLIDPRSPLYELFRHSPDRLPRQIDALDQDILTSLSTLDFLDGVMSNDTVMDCIHYIGTNPNHPDSFGFSVALLNKLYELSFNCSGLAIPGTLVWLPTQVGSLSDAHGCRPGRGQGASDEESLFDQVLEKLHSGVRSISSTLKARLGWDEPIPEGVLLEQLRLELKYPREDIVARLTTLIRELAGREPWEDNDWTTLRETLEHRAWVPVVHRSGMKLVEAWQAVLSSPFEGVYQASPTLVAHASGFLMRLGCPQTPSFDTVILQLSQLADEVPSSRTTGLAVSALKYAVRKLGLNDDQRSRLLIPDLDNHLQNFDSIVFNDVGPRCVLARLDPGQYLASKAINDELANALRLQRLGHLYTHLTTYEDDMGVSSATIVTKTLAQYTEKQFLSEFLANAEDAGATRFDVILDCGFSTGGQKEGESVYLTDRMKALYSGPSVIVCNDKEFKEADFEGIRKTHVGSKGDAVDKIGQFGLGALTMFHITECAFIFSGTEVLILDPTKSRLPMAERASAQIPLQNLMEWYPGHCAVLRGLEYYDSAAKRVNGTIFHLPLRSDAQIRGSKPLKSLCYTLDIFQRDVLADFEAKASDCLLFVGVNEIRSQKRDSDGRMYPLWCVKAHRTPLDNGDFVDTHIILEAHQLTVRETTQSHWRTVSVKRPASAIPEESRIGTNARLVRFGLAAPLDRGHDFRSKFFSTLPLAIPVTLPVHVNASFKLASDRRNIRLDVGEQETRYNRFLLGEWIPELYLALLELLAKDGDNSRWWPGTHLQRNDLDHDDEHEPMTTQAEDSLTAIIMESFYAHHLPRSTLHVFRSMFTDDTFPWSEVVLYPSRTTVSAAQIVLKTVRPRNLVKLTSVRQRLASVGGKVADAAFLRELLRRDEATRIIREKLDDVGMADLLVYLTGPDQDPSALQGLALLRLENDAWTKFETASITCYYSLKSWELVRDGIFPAHRFAFPPTLPHLLLKGSPDGPVLNVAELGGEGIQRLVAEQLPSLTESTARRSWGDAFWRLIPSMIKRKELAPWIEDLPLVPMADGVSYKTLVQIKNGEALISSREEPWLKQSLQDLGLTVVDPYDFPFDLRELVTSKFEGYSPNEGMIVGFLRAVALRGRLSLAIRIFGSWTHEKQEQFADWVKTHIYQGLDSELSATARKLPIWLSRQGNRTMFHAADGLLLLPKSVHLSDASVGRFCKNFVTADNRILRLLTYSDDHTRFDRLIAQLDQTSILHAGEDEEIYHTLVRSIVLERNWRRFNVRVPNAERHLVSAHSLFERHPVFDAAFGVNSASFLLPSFDHFDESLPLKRYHDLDHMGFAECARALQGGEGRDDVDRAAVLYREYTESLPLRLPGTQNTPGSWRSLNLFNFIPRNLTTVRHCRGHEVQLPGSITGLPRVVSPLHVVRREHYPICWTQRSQLAEEPDTRDRADRIKQIFPEFGVPSGQEVIAHLRALSRLEPSPVVLYDVQKTYEWLSDNVKALSEQFAELVHEPVFLNIENESTPFNQWAWSPASQLAFDTQELVTMKPVRSFLKPYRRLLTAAGVLEVFYPEVPDDSKDTLEAQDYASLKDMRSGLNQMRLAGEYTDVRIVPRDASDPIDRHLLRAHRNFLSTCSPFFSAQFKQGSFREGQVISDPASPLEISLPHSGIVIKAVIDFCYTGKPVPLDEPDRLKLEDLQELLELSTFLELAGLFIWTQRDITRRHLVNPETLDEVQHNAERFQAKILSQWCDQYRINNDEYLKQVDLVSRVAEN